MIGRLPNAAYTALWHTAFGNISKFCAIAQSEKGNVRDQEVSEKGGTGCFTPFTLFG